MHWMSIDGGLQQAQLIEGPTPLGPAGALLKTVRGAVGSLMSRVASAVVCVVENALTHPQFQEHILEKVMGGIAPDVVKQYCDVLESRLLFETQGAYARSVNTWNEVEEIGESSITRAVSDRENLREFCASHPECKEKLTSILRTMNAAHDIIRAIETKRFLPGRYNAPWLVESFMRSVYDKEIIRLTNIQLQNVRPGESLSIPVGVAEHDVSLEIRKTADNSCTCLLYNTGNGNGGHIRLSCSSGNDDKIYPLTWTHIPLSRLDGDFFQKVLSAQDERFKALPMPEMDMEAFLSQLRSLLGKEDSVAALSERAYREQGELGSCSTKCRSVWLRSAMNAIDPSGKLYRQFKYETTEKLIKQFDKVFPEVTGGKPDDNPNQKLDGASLSLGQLREIRKRAGEALERRRART